MSEDSTTARHKTAITRLTDVPAAVAIGDAFLVVIYGDDLGRRVPLIEGRNTIGRSPESNIQVEQDSVSRHHARIEREGSRFRAVDLGSTNGTYVNDNLAGDGLDLRDGDQVKIGRTIFKFMTGNNIEAQYHEEIYRLMTIDGLTEIHNKRYFDETLDKEASRARRYKSVFSLVIFDVDHFKSVNDTRGHLAGDAVLHHLGAIVKESVRRDDILARVGGEEFAIIVPEVGVSGARQLAEKIRKLVDDADFKFEDQIIPITISLGVAEWTDACKEADDLVRAADEKLYEAKHSGRNRVC